MDFTKRQALIFPDRAFNYTDKQSIFSNLPKSKFHFITFNK